MRRNFGSLLRTHTISVGLFIVRRCFRPLVSAQHHLLARGRAMTTLPCAKSILRALAREGVLLQHREAPASFYLQHSPSLRRLDHPFDKTGTDNQSEATAIPQLAAIVENEVTSLRALWARGFAVRPNLPAWRSLETRFRVSFLGADTTSAPLPVGKTASLLVASLRFLTGNPFLGLSSLSFSWRFVSNRPRVLSSPGPLRHRRRTPDAGQR